MFESFAQMYQPFFYSMLPAITLIGFVIFFLFLIVLTIKERKSIVLGNPDYVNRNKKKKRIEDYNVFANFIVPFLKDEYRNTIKEMILLYKLSDNEIEKKYMEVVIVSSFFAFTFFLGMLVVQAYVFSLFFLFIIYFAGNYFYLIILKSEMNAYKTALTSESIGIILQFGIHFTFTKNPIEVIRLKLIPKNKNREIIRQLEELLKNLDNTTNKLQKDILMDFKSSINGVLGLEVFCTLILNTIEQGVGANKDVASFTKNIVNQNKLVKEKKIKETISMLEGMMILFFILPFSAMLMMPSLIDKTGDLNLLDVLKTLVGNMG